MVRLVDEVSKLHNALSSCCAYRRGL